MIFCSFYLIMEDKKMDLMIWGKSLVSKQTWAWEPNAPLSLSA